MRRSTICIGSLAVAGIIAAVLVAPGILSADDDCQKPDPNSDLCADTPEDSTSSCDAANAAAGDGCDVTVYEINNFPEGDVEADKGTTSEEQADCKRSKACDLDQDTGTCVAHSGGWSGWNQATKTIVGTNACPKGE